MFNLQIIFLLACDKGMLGTKSPDSVSVCFSMYAPKYAENPNVYNYGANLALKIRGKFQKSRLSILNCLYAEPIGGLHRYSYIKVDPASGAGLCCNS